MYSSYISANSSSPSLSLTTSFSIDILVGTVCAAPFDDESISILASEVLHCDYDCR
ncbi:hypothetical protein SCLCIDRAFT_1220691 [Scleroderma citrinum Foug A]|uniref:Uncharacterized protein n=1 Tax=Scleroderma citrinum Foug A TaxID=1036808 RepID=A0A0C2Z2F2_9AGAM|nr:hypothetical protein SCLCIDRAFT_1220691 [Scleroderma citrinum Foug A]